MKIIAQNIIKLINFLVIYKNNANYCLIKRKDFVKKYAKFSKNTHQLFLIV